MSDSDMDFWELHQFGPMPTEEEQIHRAALAGHLLRAWDECRNEHYKPGELDILANHICGRLVDAFCEVMKLGRERGLALMVEMAKERQAA